jgi:hypothetical protein
MFNNLWKEILDAGRNGELPPQHRCQLFGFFLLLLLGCVHDGSFQLLGVYCAVLPHEAFSALCLPRLPLGETP